MRNEKPGGHGERSVAVGTIDMAIWDAVAKIARQLLFRLLAERHGVEPDPRVFVYAAGGYYYPDKDLKALRAEMRSYLARGYTVVKMKIGGAELEEDLRRIEAVLDELTARRSWPWTRMAALIWIRRSRMRSGFASFPFSSTKGRVILSTTGCRQRSLNTTRRQWRQVRTRSAIRTPAICYDTTA